MRLISGDGFAAFDRQLPIYNWMFPLQQQGVGKVALRRDHHLIDRDTDGISTRALYLHIPFCETICTFCPFVRGGFRDPAIIERYTRALLREIELKSTWSNLTDKPIRAIFFGGGTPSLLSPDQIGRIGQSLWDNFDLSELLEFSFEMELKSIAEERVAALRAVGVTHARFGLQTFQPRYRDLFNLTATIELAEQAIELLARYLPWMSFDLLYGMDGETVDELLDDLRRAVALGTPTIDIYPINNVSTQLRLHRAYARGGLSPTTARTKFAMNVLLNEYMRASGFLPHNGHGYVRCPAEEVARRPVVTDRYTFQYHEHVYGYDDNELIGFGASAASLLRSHTLTNTADRERYMRGLLDEDAIDFVATEHPPSADASRPVILRLPYHGAIDKRRVAWGEVDSETLRALEQAIAAGLINDEDDRLVLTQQGWYSYVNLMYFLMPRRDQCVLDSFIGSKKAEPDRRLEADELALVG